MGEPLLHPNLREFFTICGERGLKVSLTTNGTLLKEKQDILLSSPSLYRVSISVHSFEANQTGQTLEEYLQDILQFCALASQQTKTYCVLRLWNKDSAVLKAANQRNVDIFHQVREFFHLDFDPAEALEHKPSISLCDRVYLETAEKFSWPDIQQQESFDSVFCHGLRDQFGVLVDGTVVPCCLDSEGNIDLGNIYENRFQRFSPLLVPRHCTTVFHAEPHPKNYAGAAVMPSVTPSYNRFNFFASRKPAR